MTIDERAEKIRQALCREIGIFLSIHWTEDIAAEISAAVEEAMLLQMQEGIAYKNRCVAEAYEDAVKHFRAQIRTYTGEQVAKALLDLRDGKFIRARAAEVGN